MYVTCTYIRKSINNVIHAYNCAVSRCPHVHPFNYQHILYQIITNKFCIGCRHVGRGILESTDFVLRQDPAGANFQWLKHTMMRKYFQGLTTLPHFYVGGEASAESWVPDVKCRFFASYVYISIYHLLCKGSKYMIYTGNLLGQNIKQEYDKTKTTSITHTTPTKHKVHY